MFFPPLIMIQDVILIKNRRGEKKREKNNNVIKIRSFFLGDTLTSNYILLGVMSYNINNILFGVMSYNINI
jgi:hypothetical protein